jgi:hypothetical protein
LAYQLGFVKETLESFDGLCNEFRKGLDSLIKTIAKKKDEVILNKKLKLNLEKKSKYKSILTFTFNAFEDHFVELRKNFEDRFRVNTKHVFKGLGEYQNTMLVELHYKNQKLKEELSSIQIARDQLRRKKDKYFDSIHMVSLDRLTRLKNQRITGDKSWLSRFHQFDGVRVQILRALCQNQQELFANQPHPQIADISL